jgi:hypothetical protein
MATTETSAAKAFDQPDEVREFAGHGRLELVEVAGRMVGRGTFEPGWRWSVDVKPLAGTDSCQTLHLGYVLEGRMRVHMDDGTSFDCGAGDVIAIMPGHDAEVLGDETVTTLEFGEAATYAKPRT